jgi:hypothetical protein
VYLAIVSPLVLGAVLPFNIFPLGDPGVEGIVGVTDRERKRNRATRS